MKLAIKVVRERALPLLVVLTLTACASGVDQARDPGPLLQAVRKTAGGKWFYDREILDNAERVCLSRDESKSTEELSAYGFTAAQVAVLLKEAPKYCGK